jgi:hypothetical protein
VAVSAVSANAIGRLAVVPGIALASAVYRFSEKIMLQQSNAASE